MSARVRPAKVRGRQIEEIRDADPNGRPVLHYQVIDPLTRMLRGGTIAQRALFAMTPYRRYPCGHGSTIDLRPSEGAASAGPCGQRLIGRRGVQEGPAPPRYVR